MAKDNLFLGFARGAVGDVVFSRLNGEQVSRARNRAPHNPKSVLQLSQRVILKTASLAYSYLQDIANHSFEGFSEGTPNQSRFVSLAVAQMRGQVADVLQSGSDQEILDSDAINFSNAQETYPVLRPYQIAEGSLSQLSLRDRESTPTASFALSGSGSVTAAADGDMTYAQACQYLGVDQGDQVTLCFLLWTGGVYLDSPCFSRMVTARIIMEPADGDMSKKFWVRSNANPRDEVPDGFVISGEVGATAAIASLYVDTPFAYAQATPLEGAVAAYAAIHSKKVGDMWLRSNAQFAVVNNIIYQGAQFGSAVRSFQRVQSSNLYLNQSE